jgi:putative flippase GtrA
MARERVSYRNPLFSALLFAFLYFVISNIFYLAFHGHLSFVPYHYFEWIEYALGTIVMFVLAFIVEFVRNLTGKRGA